MQGYQGGWKLQHTVQRQRLRETQFSLKQGRQSRDLTTVFYCPKGLIVKMLFPEVKRHKAVVTHKLQHVEFQLNIRKKFFPRRVIMRELPSKVVGTPSLKMFKTHLHKALSNPTQL